MEIHILVRKEETRRRMKNRELWIPGGSSPSDIFLTILIFDIVQGWSLFIFSYFFLFPYMDTKQGWAITGFYPVDTETETNPENTRPIDTTQD